MQPVFAQLIPLAVAAAFSTVPMSATMFMLLSERRGAVALPFLSGWVLSTAAGLSVALLAAQVLPDRPRPQSSIIGSLEVVVGSALVLLGVVTLVARGRVTSAQRPRWIEGIGSVGSLPAFGIGLALNVRPKALLLFAAASLTITDAHANAEDTVIAIIVYTAIATSTVVAPTLAALAFPTRMEPLLLATRDWLTAHGAAVTGVVMVVIGVVVLAAGIAG